jgi:two pore calcium channel protein 3
MLAISIISIVEIIINFTVEGYPFGWFSTLARLMFLFILVKTLRKTWYRFMYVMVDSWQMFVFITFYVLFFALLGMRIFKGSVEGVQYFPTYVESCFNMLVLLTTANSPDIMLPAYEQSRGLALFFIFYLMIGVFLLMHLLMALFYYNYKCRYEEQLSVFRLERDAYLETKFNELDVENKGYLNKQQAFEMFK